jgi:hypothetical protein
MSRIASLDGTRSEMQPLRPGLTSSISALHKALNLVLGVSINDYESNGRQIYRPSDNRVKKPTREALVVSQRGWFLEVILLGADIRPDNNMVSRRLIGRSNR